MENRTGRLDLLLLGIIERLASRDPVCSAVYQTFEPEIRALLKDLDSPRLRRAVKALASGGGSVQQEPVRRKRKPAFRPRVRLAKPGDKPVEVVEAEWVS